MKEFEFYNPTEVHFGNGKAKSIGKTLEGKYKKVLLVAAKGPFRDNGVYDLIAGEIKKSGAQLYEMTDIDSNPKLSSVYEGKDICLKNSVDCVLALGGGSALDCAKVIAASAKSGIDPYDMLWGKRISAEESLDTVMVPTIAATGTELNNTAVIVNDETKEKYFCICEYPTYAFMDPELTATLPLPLLIWGSMDILSHTFEFYFNGCTESEFQSRFSEAVIKAVMKSVERIMADPEDINARGELMWCAAMTWGTGLTKIGRGDPDMTCHSIEESFSGYFDIHHGACLGVLTPRWMEHTLETVPAPFAMFARNIFAVDESDDKSAAGKGVELYKKWLKSVNAPITYFDFSDKKFTDDELTHVAETAYKVYNGNIGRLKKYSLEEITQLLKKGKEKY